MKKSNNVTNAPPAVTRQGECSTRARDLALCSSAHARKRLSYQNAIKWSVLPLGLMNVRGHSVLTIAGDLTKKLETEQALQFITDCTINMVQADPDLLLDAIFIAYRGEQEALHGLIGDIQDSSLPSESSQTKGLGGESKPGQPSEGSLQELDESSVPALVYRLLEYGISRGATDLSLIPELRGRFSCKLRVDGSLISLDLTRYSPELHKRVINRIKVLAKVASETEWTPVDGMIEVPLPTGSKQVRFHIFPTVHGAKIHFRLPAHKLIPKISELGFSAKTHMFLEAVLERASGSIILSGPTGSGKTTTAYSALQKLGSSARSIVSLEDPVERELPNVSQTDLSRTPGLSYANAIKHVMRQDPDVIFIGEIRDEVSAKIALEAAATGHLLVASVHSGRALEALNRLVRLAGDRDLVADAVSLIITQRLLPVLCPRCRVIDLRASNVAGQNIYQAVGCSECEQSGYSGRTLVDESLYLTKEPREQFRSNALKDEELFGKRYFQRLEDSIQAAVFNGQVDVKSAKAIVSSSV